MVCRPSSIRAALRLGRTLEVYRYGRSVHSITHSNRGIYFRLHGGIQGHVVVHTMLNNRLMVVGHLVKRAGVINLRVVHSNLNLKNLHSNIKQTPLIQLHHMIFKHFYTHPMFDCPSFLHMPPRINSSNPIIPNWCIAA